MKKLGENRIISPLSSSFMLTSIVGFLISVFYVPSLDYQFSLSYSIAFAIVFAGMFIASLLSMTYSPFSDHLQIDEKRNIKL